MGREENVAVFIDTERLCKENKQIMDFTFEAASKHKGNQIAVHNFASASNPGAVRKGELYD